MVFAYGQEVRMRIRTLCSTLVLGASLVSSAPVRAQDCLRAGIAHCDEVFPGNNVFVVAARGYCYLAYLHCAYPL